MPKKRYRPEEIISKPREADVLISQGKKVVEVIKTLGVTDVTYYRWRQESIPTLWATPFCSMGR